MLLQIVLCTCGGADGWHHLFTSLPVSRCSICSQDWASLLPGLFPDSPLWGRRSDEGGGISRLVDARVKPEGFGSAHGSLSTISAPRAPVRLCQRQLILHAHWWVHAAVSFFLFFSLFSEPRSCANLLSVSVCVSSYFHSFVQSFLNRAFFFWRCVHVSVKVSDVCVD